MIKHTSIFFSCLLLATVACNNHSNSSPGNAQASGTETIKEASADARHFRGALNGGMKGDSIFFDVSADGTRLENLTFKGYWYCDGNLERQNAAGPQGHFRLENGKVNDHISEPADGGATAWRFDLSATIDGNKASGSFRMNINALRCNTGTLSWEAVAQ